MYAIGMLVLYKKRGVYRIESVGPSPAAGVSGDYYKLCAVFSNSNETIYTPVDMVSSMRPLISRSEAVRHLERLARLEPRGLRPGRTADLTAHYRDMLESNKVEDCLLLMKEICARRQEMARQKKRPGQADAQYLKLAEKLICEEFSVVLNTAPDLFRERLYAAMQCRATA